MYLHLICIQHSACSPHSYLAMFIGQCALQMFSATNLCLDILADVFHWVLNIPLVQHILTWLDISGHYRRSFPLDIGDYTCSSHFNLDSYVKLLSRTFSTGY